MIRMGLLDKAKTQTRIRPPRSPVRAKFLLAVLGVAAAAAVVVFVVLPEIEARSARHPARDTTTARPPDTARVARDTSESADPVSAHVAKGDAGARAVASVLKSAPMWTRLADAAKSPAAGVAVTAMTSGKSDVVYVMCTGSDPASADAFARTLSDSRALSSTQVVYREREADGLYHFTVRGSRVADDAALYADWATTRARFPADTAVAWNEARRLASNAGLSATLVPLSSDRHDGATFRTARVSASGSSSAALVLLSSIESARVAFEVRALGTRLSGARARVAVEIAVAALP